MRRRRSASRHEAELAAGAKVSLRPEPLLLLATLSGTPVAAVQTFDEVVAAYERGDYAAAMRGFHVHAK